MPTMPEKSVNFDNLNSFNDLNIVFETLTIGAAEPQLVLIDVPFRNGALDETDAFGDVRYKDRTITMGFLIPWWLDDQYGIFSNVQARLNGMRRKITFSADSNWYYEGRLKVGDFKIEDGFWKFEIEATVAPYKKTVTPTIVNVTATTSGTEIQLSNDYMKVIPAFTTIAEVRVDFEDNTVTFSEGTHKSTSIILKEGNNTLTLYGDSEVIIEYEQGRL